MQRHLTKEEQLKIQRDAIANLQQKQEQMGRTLEEKREAHQQSRDEEYGGVESLVRDQESMLQQREELGILKSKHDLTPTEAPPVEAKLSAGAPEGYGKIRRSRWNRQVKGELQEAQKRDAAIIARKRAFFEEEKVDYEAIQYALGTKEEQDTRSSSQYADIAYGTITRRTPDFLKVCKDGSQPPLTHYLHNLITIDPDTLNLQETKVLIDRYKELHAASHLIGEAQLDERGVIEQNPHAAWVFLMQCATDSLMASLNAMPDEQVDHDELARLYALSRRMNLVATALYASKSYHDQKKEIRDRLLEEEAVSEREAVAAELLTAREQERLARQELAEVRKDFIRTGRGEMRETADANWPLGDYAEAAIRVLGDRLTELPEKEFSAEVTQLARRLELNLWGIDRAVEQVATADTGAKAVFKSEIFKQLLRELLIRNVGDAILTESYATELVSQHTDRVMHMEKVEGEELAGRLDRLVASPEILQKIEKAKESCRYLTADVGSPALEEKLLTDREILSFALGVGENKDPEAVEGALLLMKENISESCGYIRKWASENMPGFEGRFTELFYRNYGDHILSKSLSETQEMLRNLKDSLRVVDPDLYAKVRSAEATRTQSGASHGAFAEDVSNVSRMKGALLCANELFGDSFKGYEDAIADAIVKIASSGAFEAFGLKAGCTKQDINNLSPSRMRLFVSELELRMLQNLEAWDGIRGVDEAELKRSLAEGLLQDTPEQFIAHIRERDDEARKDASFREVRIRQLLLGSDHLSKKAVFDYKKRTKSTAFHWFGNAESRQKRRQDRMKAGRTMRDAMLQEVSETTGRTRWEEALENMDRYLKAPVSEKKKIAGSLPKDAAFELWICDAETHLADRYAGAVQGLEIEAYRKALTPFMQMHIERQIVFFREVRAAGYDLKEGLPPALSDLYNRLLPMMNDETEDYTSTVREALKIYRSETGSEAHEKELDARALLVVETRERRIAILRKEGGPEIEPFIPEIMSDPKYFRIFSIYSDERFAEQMEAFKRTVIPAAKVMAVNYQRVPAFIRDQFIHNLRDRFFQEGTDIKALLANEYNALLKSNIAIFNKSIQERIDRLKDGKETKYSPIEKYFDAVMESIPESVLEKDTDYYRYLGEILPFIRQNDRAREAFLAEADYSGVAAERIEAVKTAFRLRTKGLIALRSELSADDMQMIIDECITAETATLEKTEQADKALSGRRDAWLFVETEKSRGREISRRRQALVNAAERQITEHVKEAGSDGMAAEHEAIPAKRLKLATFRHLAPRMKLRPYLDAEFGEALKLLSYEMYLTDEEQFTREVEDQLAYFNAAADWDNKVIEELTARGLQDDRALVCGIHEYFYAKLHDGAVNIEALYAELTGLLNDGDKRAYLANSESVLGSISYDSLTQSELTPFTVMNREQFTDLIRTEGTDEMYKAFTALSVEERQVFAIVLSIPGLVGETDSLPGMEYVYSNIVSRKAMSDARGAIGNFRNGEPITAPVDYALAASNLTVYNSEGVKTVDEQRFADAMAFVNVASYIKQKANEPDLARLGTAPEQTLKDLGYSYDLNVQTEADFINKVTAIEDTDSAASATKERLKEFADKSADRLRLLIMVLQDRTMFDYTTTIGWYDRRKGKVHSFVNEGARSEWMAAMGEQEDHWLTEPITGEMLRSALAQLYSFQIKDDIRLGRKITKDDLAEARKTKGDWELLGRAMDFVDELHNENLRIKAIRHASDRNMILKSGNEKAVSLYTDHEDEAMDQKTLEQILIRQAKSDDEIACIIGFLRLSEAEKSLFFTALSRRDVLDISKQDIMLDRFGMKDREFANAAGRNELIDVYIRNGRIDTDSELYKRAFMGCISTQLADDVDYDEVLGLEDTQTNKSFFKFTRGTAIDWKLFTRALQIVHRANMERDQYRQEQMLSDTYTDAVKEGIYRGDFSLMRGNIHHAGTRFTRFLAGRVADELMDLIPASIQFAVRSLLPISWSNAVNGLKPFGADDDDDSFVGKVGEIGEIVSYPNDYLNEDPIINKGMKALKNVDTSGFTGTVMDAAETVGDVSDYVTNGLAILQALNNERKLIVAKWDAEEMHDEKTLAETVAKMTEQEDPDQEILAKFLEQSWKQTERGVNLGSDESQARDIDRTLNAISELLSGPAEDVNEAVGPIVVKEAVHLLNFFRSYFHDRSNIAAFFAGEAEETATMDALRTNGITLTEDPSGLSFICRARGFENLTEAASFVGMSIAQSLLFAASRFNTGQKGLKLIATVVLANLGCGDCVGQLGGEAAEKVYGSLLGEDRG
ncbi:MAG: hypothetical protein E7300_02415 [Lachnospiraceae bacterium]|nr:hypothetical protein [Lachnospiraceae bacterium]